MLLDKSSISDQTVAVYVGQHQYNITRHELPGSVIAVVCTPHGTNIVIQNVEASDPFEPDQTRPDRRSSSDNSTQQPWYISSLYLELPITCQHWNERFPRKKVLATITLKNVGKHRFIWHAKPYLFTVYYSVHSELFYIKKL